MIRGLASRSRKLSTSLVRRDLFGGKIPRNAQPQMAPSNKSETTSNPADMWKKNDILMFSQKPINYIESIRHNGYYLANNILITSPNKKGSQVGTLLLDTESFEIDLSSNAYKEINGFLIEFDEQQVLSIFEKIHPKPEIIVVGLGKKSRMLSEKNRKYLSGLGMQIEAGSSRNAARNYDLLATERPGVVAALLLPPNV